MSESKSSKLWKAESKESSEVFWIRGKTKPEIKKKLRHYFGSEEFWDGKPIEELIGRVFKSYSSELIDCPGIFLDDSRGDVLVSLTDPSLDWFDNDTRTKKKKKKTV